MSLPSLPPGVTPDLLAEAVATSASWRAVLRAFGLTTTHKGRQMRKYCDAAGIEYGHFGQRSYDAALLRAAVAGARSWRDVLTLLGVAEDSGSARASVRRSCQQMGIDLTDVESRQPEPDGLHLQADLRNLRTAGSHLVAAALALSGLRVSWPLEPTVYDLLAEDPWRRVHRIQVKTTTRRAKDTWICGITRSTHRAGGGTRRTTYDPDDIDMFGIVDGDLTVYLVPVAAAAGRTSLSLRRYERYRLSAPPRIVAQNAAFQSG